MTIRVRSTLLATAAVTLLGAVMVWTGSNVRAAAPQAAAKERSVWDGVYSDAQSVRGEKLYADTCASCHAADLTGSQIVPTLVGEDFLTKWNGAMAGDLFELIRTTMPQDKPESIPPAQVSDVIAFIFKGNKMPAGKAELAGDFEGLKAIRIEPKKN